MMPPIFPWSKPYEHPAKAIVIPNSRSLELKISFGSFFQSGEAHSDVPPPIVEESVPAKVERS